MNRKDKKAYNQQYYAKHRAELQERARERKKLKNPYAEHKERNTSNHDIICSCGKEMRRDSVYRHWKSKTHLDAIGPGHENYRFMNN